MVSIRFQPLSPPHRFRARPLAQRGRASRSRVLMSDSERDLDSESKLKCGNVDEDCEKVVSHVACVTLESDSLPETPNMPRAVRKKKRLVRRPRGYKMDVDPQPSTSQSKPDSRMDWDGAESCISSTSESDGGNCAADADDEQSDWVGYAPSVTEGSRGRTKNSAATAKVADVAVAKTSRKICA
ncbi:hypothetical protein RB195_001981 [Necator americanus]|uniref:Uncharacterized protein n=1 Tax=Necator americanus TaxID=51031 RepID=A0ABR1DGU0_NECAM